MWSDDARRAGGDRPGCCRGRWRESRAHPGRCWSAVHARGTAVERCHRNHRTETGEPLRITLNQEPDTLNPFYSGLRATFTVTQAIFNGLVVVNEQGDYEGDLAAEVPTVQNGDVSPDGLTITYKLRQGVKWADGEPFTADDVKFTYDTIMNPAKHDLW